MNRFVLSLAGLATMLLASPSSAAPANYQMTSEYQAGSDAYAHGDYGEAARLLRIAATKGDTGAEMMLGGLYNVGEGVPTDYGQAMHWYLLAADAGWGEVMNNIAKLYEKGQGVPQDKVQALKWYLLAEANMPAAPDMAATLEKNRAAIAATMTAAEIQRAQEQAAAWKPGGR